MAPADTPTPDETLTALRAALGAQYRVEHLLGKGGMGSVYLGHDVTLDRPVAIKVINPEVASNATLRDRFLQEARTVARLRHPSIVPVYAAGDAGGLLYFVMEFVEGESLRDVLVREGRITGDRAERILREVAVALDHAHAQALVHRDVKPENILIEKTSGRAMLTDFGVSRAFEGDGGLTQTGMIVGSPRYMSPEQASGDRAIDGRSDLYSLALVGYEMYTGAPVVQSGTAAGMLVKHLTETPPPLAERVEGVPPTVAAAIDRGLAKKPEERWPTGHAFAAGLAGHSVSSDGTPITVAPRPTRTRRIPVAAIAGAVVVLGGAAWWALGRAPADTAYLVAPFEIQSGDQSVRWLREGSVNMLTLTLGQWSDLNVVDYERTLSLLDAEDLGSSERLSLDDALRIARRARAGTVVTGQIQTTRDSLLVVARLYDVRSGKSVNQAQEGDALTADPRPVFDRLAQQLLDIQGGRTSTVQLAAATTTNLEAYRAYLDGVKLLNGWRLTEAEREFARAIALDSTFALAHHKRSLGLGWAEAGGPNYAASADRAFELASRLPPRERALVTGHYHLSKGLLAEQARDTTRARTAYQASIASYTDLIARGDSLVAEAWYGVADAYFHARGTPLPNHLVREYTTLALRGFHRTLAIDSTYHLAYSHLVQLYNTASLGSNLLISGDSSILVAEQSDVTRLGGPAGIQRYRDSAAARGLDIARAWTRADVSSAQPFLQLAQSFAAAGRLDSTTNVLRDALRRPQLPSVPLRMTLMAAQVVAADTGLATTFDQILSRYPPDSLHTLNFSQRIPSNGMLVAAAAMLGRSGDLDRAAALFTATDPTFPFSTRPSAPTLDLYKSVLRVAMGDSVSSATRRSLVDAMRTIDTTSGRMGDEMRAGSQSMTYLSFLATHDTVFRSFLRRWSPQDMPELDALAALHRGDTATAERIARAFPHPDSLRTVRFSIGGMRPVARAEVLAALGHTRQAAETYEIAEPHRFNQTSLSEPGYTVWVRTWLARARLWRQLGERERAIAAYEEFIRRWSTADGVAARQVAAAKRELAEMRDAPAAR